MHGMCCLWSVLGSDNAAESDFPSSWKKDVHIVLLEDRERRHFLSPPAVAADGNRITTAQLYSTAEEVL